MWDWLESVGDAITKFEEKHSTLVSVATSVAVGVLVGAAVTVATVTLAGPIGAAVIAGCVAGGVASAYGYFLKQELERKPVDGWQLAKTVALGCALGGVTAGLGAKLVPAVQGAFVTPVVERVVPELSAPTQQVIANATASASVNAGLGSGSKFVENAVTDQPLMDGVFTAGAIGFAQGAAGPAITKLVDPLAQPVGNAANRVLRVAGRTVAQGAEAADRFIMGPDAPVKLPIAAPAATPEVPLVPSPALRSTSGETAASREDVPIKLPSFPTTPSETPGARAPATPELPAAPQPEPPAAGIVQALEGKSVRADPRFFQPWNTRPPRRLPNIEDGVPAAPPPPAPPAPPVDPEAPIRLPILNRPLGETPAAPASAPVPATPAPTATPAAEPPRAPAPTELEGATPKARELLDRSFGDASDDAAPGETPGRRLPVVQETNCFPAGSGASRGSSGASRESSPS